ncbi:hypothetical protein Goshw_001020, partial [Gossypium schwendimanii]|nr:hypothetical protein [Gossypium schwendimanii]
GTTWSSNEIIKVSYSWAKQFLLSEKRPIEKYIRKPIICFNSFGSGIYLNTDGSVRHEDGSMAVEGVTNSLEVVMVIQESLIGGPNSALIGRVLQLLYQIRHWNICYRPREENQEDDRLAKLAHLESQ